MIIPKGQPADDCQIYGTQQTAEKTIAARCLFPIFNTPQCGMLKGKMIETVDTKG
jgi:hypothetical protein